MIPSGFQRVSIFEKPLFSPSAWVMIFTILVEPFLVIITINLILHLLPPNYFRLGWGYEINNFLSPYHTDATYQIWLRLAQ